MIKSALVSRGLLAVAATAAPLLRADTVPEAPLADVQTIAPVAVPEYEVVSNNCFAVASVDRTSAAWVASRGKLLWERLEKTFPIQEILRVPLTVDLIPQESWQLEAPYLLQTNARGRVTLDILWNEQTPQALVDRLLIQEILTKARVFHYPGREPDMLPAWLVSAAYVEAVSPERPGFIRILKNTLRDTEAWPLEQFMQLAADDALADKALAESHALLELVSKETGSRFQTATTLFLALNTPNDLYRVLSDSRFNSLDELESWWQAGRKPTTRTPGAIIESMKQSREKLRGQIYVVVRVKPEGQEDTEWKALNLVEAIKRLDDPEVIQAIENQLLKIQQRLLRINPVYYNTQLSIAQAWEAVSKNNFEILPSLVTQLQNDMRIAKEIEDSIGISLFVEEKMQQEAN